MVDEDQLSGWTGPSSTSEQEKQDRAERMIREAIAAHVAFADIKVDVYTKGSYANNTNVKAESDVDIVVECCDLFYYEDRDRSRPNHGTIEPYEGAWGDPAKFRREVKAALEAKFPGSVKEGSVALFIEPSSARVDADVVPSFTYRDYFPDGSSREGTRVFKADGTHIDNYPQLQLRLGREKNSRTNGAYKKAVRILKRLENLLVVAGLCDEVPSYLLECLTYNCDESYFSRVAWRDVLQGCLADIYNYTMRAEPIEEAERWLEANGAKYLFHPSQKWTRAQVHAFAQTAWNYLEFE